MATFTHAHTYIYTSRRVALKIFQSLLVKNLCHEYTGEGEGGPVQSSPCIIEDERFEMEPDFFSTLGIPGRKRFPPMGREEILIRPKKDTRREERMPKNHVCKSIRIWTGYIFEVPH